MMGKFCQMKRKIYPYCLLLAGLVFIVSGCGEQKQEKAAGNKTQVRPEPRRVTLRDALEQKFGVKEEGWDANKNRFVRIVQIVDNMPNRGADYSVTPRLGRGGTP